MVDIIIPYYNNREGLNRALSSLVSQTCPVKTSYKEMVITIIDDCSDEPISDIVDYYKNYINLNYIKLEYNHKYPGIVRQQGVENTKEPYIMFLDSDDMFTNEAFDIILDAIAQTEYPFIQGYFIQQQPTSNGKLECIEKKEAFTWLHGNIYKRDFLEKNNIKFYEGYNEDSPYNLLCKSYCEPHAVIPYNIVYWMYNDNSLTRNRDSNYYSRGDGDFINNIMKSFTQLVNTLEEKEYDNLARQFGSSICKFYELLNNRIATITDIEAKKQYEKWFYKTLKSHYKTIEKIFVGLKREKLFKAGFLSTYYGLDFVNPDNPMDINEFLRKTNINTYFSMKDIIALSDKNMKAPLTK